MDVKLMMMMMMITLYDMESIMFWEWGTTNLLTCDWCKHDYNTVFIFWILGYSLDFICISMMGLEDSRM